MSRFLSQQLTRRGGARMKWLMRGLIICCLCGGLPAFGEPPAARQPLGEPSMLENWSGLERAPGAGPDGEDAARLQVPGAAEFSYPEGEAGDWSGWPVLALEVKLPDSESAAELAFSLKPDPLDERRIVWEGVTISALGGSWRTVRVPLRAFQLNESAHAGFSRTVLERVGALRVEAEGDTSEALMASPRLQRGHQIALNAPVKSRPGDPGETIEYDVDVLNVSDSHQAVALHLEREGGEVMVTEVEPDRVRLEPGETNTVTVRAQIPPAEEYDLPEGGRERWTLAAVPDGRFDLAERVDFIHVVRMEPPYIIHTEEDWDGIRKLVESEDWARTQAEDRIKQARDWRPGGLQHEDRALNAAIVWQLTRNKEFAEKTADYFRRFVVSEDIGRGRGLRFHQRLARAYDLIRDAGVLSVEDEAGITEAFRAYLRDYRPGGIGNQQLWPLEGALYLALTLQDWRHAERFLEGPLGVEWQIRRAIMDDGWWWELSTGYSMGCASSLTQIGLALQPWGIELLETKFPAVYHEDLESTARPGERAGPWGGAERRAGMFAAAWGPSHRNYRQVRDLWDSVADLMTVDRTLPGLNDAGPEHRAGGQFDIAAYAYGDPEFVRHATGRNLLYPVDRSEVEERLRPSSVADNAGVAMLRSQGVASPEQQYSALLSYGSHGAHHGHWDRLNLVYLRRFGKLATHTRTAWSSYGTPLYQMYYQTSLAHSMVVVDSKNQYPAPSDRLLFHSGDLFQAAAVENKTHWSHPRFLGHVGYSEEDKERGYVTPGRWRVEIPEDAPPGGHMTEPTEPVVSRRAVAVTDDYVLVLDHVRGEQEHTFDALYYFGGFQGFDGDLELVDEWEKFDDDYRSAGQFITDCRVYEAAGTVRSTFVTGYDPEAYNPAAPLTEIEDGWETLTTDVYSVWPRERRLILGRGQKRRGMQWEPYSAGRAQGREASFITLIEMREDSADRQVREVTADGPDEVEVELTDGRIHRWRISGLDAEERRPRIELKLIEEDGEGRVSREETAR